MMNKLTQKLRNRKGFTLMEMLIVIAIIAILIAIAIPTFASQLDKARKATDEANIRSAYAVAQACLLTNSDPGGKDMEKKEQTVSYTMKKDGSFGTTGTEYGLLSNVTAGTVPTVPDFSGSKGDPIVIQVTTSANGDVERVEVSNK